MKCLFAKQTSKSKPTLYHINKKNYNIFNNFPITRFYYSRNKPVTFDKNTYNTYIEAYLSKKWTLKQEIPPKIQILNIPESFKSIVSSQKISKVVTYIKKELLRFQYDNGYINTNYLFNITFEKNEINLYKSIADKLILNGYVAKQEDSIDYENVKSRIDELVNIFFKGDELTKLDKAIQFIYIEKKIANYLHSKQSTLYKNSCVLTEKDIKQGIGLDIQVLMKNKKLAMQLDPKLMSFNFNDICEVNHSMKSYAKKKYTHSYNI